MSPYDSFGECCVGQGVALRIDLAIKTLQRKLLNSE